MTYLYVVRCDFVRPDLEQRWNDWYSGEKIRQMLDKPMFRAAQRFRLAGGGGRRYLALWQLASPDALTTSEYTADWGFSKWQPYIADWSRDLFDATRVQDANLAVSMQGLLQVISFDGMDAKQANTAREALAIGMNAMWFNSSGLDRSTPMIGLKRFSDIAAAQSSLDEAAPSAGQVGYYRPVTEYCAAATLAHDSSDR